MMKRSDWLTALAALVLAAALIGVPTWLLDNPSAGTALAQADGENAKNESGPAVIALKFHADWCGSCKAMGPAYEELQEKFDNQPVLWLVLDHTRKHHRTQSAYLAHALDLDTIWTEHGGKTGFVLLIDPDSKTVLAKLTHQHELKQMGTELAKAVNAAKS